MPEDEAEGEKGSANVNQTAEFRPQRMGLGCSKEMIQEKISENAKKSRLSKLLKRQQIEEEEVRNATSLKLKRSRLDEDSDDELSKTSLVTKRTTCSTAGGSIPVMSSSLSKNQRKRLKQKLKAEQKKHMNS